MPSVQGGAAYPVALYDSQGNPLIISGGGLPATIGGPLGALALAASVATNDTSDTLYAGTLTTSTSAAALASSQRGAVSYLGRPSGRAYLGGNNPFDKYVDADPRDVPHLESLGVWRVVPGQRPAAPPPPPAPIAPAPTVEARPERPIADMAPELAANEAAVNTAAAAMARTQRGRKVA